MIDLKKLLTKTEKLSLLIVEDYIPLLNEMHNLLIDYFSVVDIASNGKEGIKRYREYQNRCSLYYDIVISDIDMPHTNGIEMIKMIRDINKKQKIIVLSAHTDSQYLLQLINLSISHFITKPLESDTLFEVIYKVSKEITVTNNFQKDNNSILNLGEDYIWIKDELLLNYKNKEVKLSRSMLILMQPLAQKCKSISTNEDIVQHFYKYGIDIGEESVRNLIYRLRKKLPDNAIDSCYGMGYKLNLKR